MRKTFCKYALLCSLILFSCVIGFIGCKGKDEEPKKETYIPQIQLPLDSEESSSDTATDSEEGNSTPDSPSGDSSNTPPASSPNENNSTENEGENNSGNDNSSTGNEDSSSSSGNDDSSTGNEDSSGSSGDENEGGDGTGSGDSSGDENGSGNNENEDGTDEDLTNPDPPKYPCDSDKHEEGDYVYEHTFVTERVEPDCIKTGYETTFCGVCGEVKDYEEIPALGHVKMTVVGFDPTCKTEGATDWDYCDRCGIILKESQSIPTVDHDYYNEGCCIWCDLTYLKFELVEPKWGKAYARCTGALLDQVHRVVIPATTELEVLDEKTNNKYLATFKVEEIAAGAFKQHYEMYSIEIGENVRIIGTEAFRDCFNLSEVYDRSKMKVGEISETENGWLTRYVDEKDIHYEEFESKISYSDTGCVMFDDRKDVVLVSVTNAHSHVVIPEGVTKINRFVFTRASRVTELTIAASVREIEWWAFYIVCETHAEEQATKTHIKCVHPIKAVTFVDPTGWSVDIDGGDEYDYFIEMDYDLSDSFWAWHNIIVMREYYWLRTDYLESLS